MVGVPDLSAAVPTIHFTTSFFTVRIRWREAFGSPALHDTEMKPHSLLIASPIMDIWPHCEYWWLCTVDIVVHLPRDSLFWRIYVSSSRDLPRGKSD